jgi:hypothetical protein
MADSSSNDSTSGGPWSQRGFVAAAAFLGIVIVAAVGILLIGPGDSGDSGGGTRPQGGNNGKPGASADPAASVCGLKPGSQEIPETPPDAKWTLVGKVAVPSSSDVGPARREGALRACYAHSPTGALFAAANFVAVASLANVDKEVVGHLVANNSDRDAFLNDLEQSRSGSRAQIAGFRIVGASKDEASVELAFNAVNGEGRSGVVSATFPMRWEQGDWKFVATAGDDPYSIQPLDSTSGFIPWGGA